MLLNLEDKLLVAVRENRKLKRENFYLQLTKNAEITKIENIKKELEDLLQYNYNFGQFHNAIRKIIKKI